LAYLRESRMIKAPINSCIGCVVTRLVMSVILVVVLYGCATSRAPVEEDAVGTTGAEPVEEDAVGAARAEPVEEDAARVTSSDLVREYSVPLEELFEACKEACKDVGADYHEPHYDLRGEVATIVACSRTLMYALIMQVYRDCTQVLLVIEFPDDTPEKPRAEEIKRVYDEFWEALEARL
jgi:hypothetical protein